jgi:hypothetical protein
VFFLSWKNSAVLIFLGFTALDLGPSALNLRPALQDRPPSYFAHVSITTPVISALKKLSYLELSRTRSSGVLTNGYFKLLLDPGAKRPLSYVTVSLAVTNL